MRHLLLPLMFGIAVLGTMGWWWLGTSESGRIGLSPQVPIGQSPGIRMEKFSLRDTQHHQTRWEILADIAHLDPKADTTRIEGVHLTLFSENRGTVQVIAHQGVIDNQSKNMQVCGEVRLTVGQDFALSTECLTWQATKQALETDNPVTIQMGAFQVQGLGFQGWLGEERFEINNQVTARWSTP